MQPVYRQLAPAPPGMNPEPCGAVPQEKKKKKARMACNYCRLKRVRCDQGRPECNRCVNAGLLCVYLSEDAGATPTMALKSENEVLQRRLRGHTQYLEAIQNATEEEAFNIVRRLRSTDIATALALPYQDPTFTKSHSSGSASVQAVTPSADSDLRFVMKTMPFSALTPASPSTIAPASLIRRPSQPMNTAGSSTEPFPGYDARLEGLRVGYWTQIPLEDRPAARAISHLLMTGNPVLGFLDATKLLNDLANHTLFYCSSFLFHVIMALACQLYSAVELSIAPFAPAFVDEALTMWPTERSTDSQSTLAALNCLSVATGWDGRNELVDDCLLEDARAMAVRMQLIDVAPALATVAPHQLHCVSEDEMGSVTQGTWDSYGWES